MNKKKPQHSPESGEKAVWDPGFERARKYYEDRLAEPELLELSVCLNVEANDAPLAVPVGKLRRGGHIEFLSAREARKAMAILRGRAGFPDLRFDGYMLSWGDPIPFNGCDYTNPICAMLLGIHYGYKAEKIAEQMAYYGHPSDRRKILKLVRSETERLNSVS